MEIETIILDSRLEGRFDPSYHSDGAAAIDLRACVYTQLTLNPGDRVKIETGLAIHISEPTYAGIIIARSGLGSRGLILSNGTGLIDSDYQGEIIVHLWNSHPTGCHVIDPMDRIAQLLIIPVRRAQLKLVNRFTKKTKRGTDGFGSTGTA